MEFLTDQAGRRIVYNKLEGKDAKIIFLGGLMSDRMGTKATFLENHAKEKQYGYIRFDYLGHGDSDLKFSECGIDDWIQNSLLVLDKLTTGKVILVGSSLGGWLAYLIALARPERISAILTLAAAPDFTEDLMWNIFSPEIQNKIMQGEIYNLPSDYCDGSYPISKKLIESGRQYFLLKDNKPIQINVPTTLIHGMNDEDVPYQYSLKLAEKLASQHVKTICLKNSDHRLSTEKELKIIAAELDGLALQIL